MPADVPVPQTDSFTSVDPGHNAEVKRKKIVLIACIVGILVFLGTVIAIIGITGRSKKSATANTPVRQVPVTNASPMVPFGDFQVATSQTGDKVSILWDQTYLVFAITVYDKDTPVFALSDQPIGKRVVKPAGSPAPDLAKVLPKAWQPKTFLPNPYQLGSIPSGYYDNASASASTKSMLPGQFLSKAKQYVIEVKAIQSGQDQIKTGKAVLLY